MAKPRTPDPALFAFVPFSELEPGFVGRSSELEVLSREFQAGKRLGSIVGTVGVGKTSLALVFCAEAEVIFPGGLNFLYAVPNERIESEIQRPRSAPSLLVVDEAQRLDRKAAQTLEEALHQNPLLHVLLVGQRVPELEFQEQFTISLRDFLEAEALQLLVTRLGSVDSAKASELYSVLGGNPVALSRAALALYEGRVTWREVVSGIGEFYRPGILGPDGRPLSHGSEAHSKIVLDVSKTNQEVLAMLRLSPEKWHSLPPRKFEEVVAELLARLGYAVELTPASGDGGFDIYAAKRESLGEFLFLVECKRFVPPHKVGVHIVRSLQGVLSERRANGAAIVTTSFFTAGAHEFRAKFQHQLYLHDYLVLQKWLRVLGENDAGGWPNPAAEPGGSAAG